ncbi:hypothetical protein N6H14_04115 [Paenibacillus sp. CC-CFT747]|nr:hypothetical protein N6H14_04115 [Paenibacillus sp. CC-CFT747]
MIEAYETAFLQEYYPMSEGARSRTQACLTSSGMKALEVALLLYRTMTDRPLPLYHQVGYYYEGITLIRDLYPDARAVTVEDIYAMLDRGEEMGCLLLEPGLTWPVHEGIDLDLLFRKLERHRQSTPLFLIIDRTLTGMANPFFERYADRMPGHVVLVSIESGIKYWQLGLELTNLGFLVLSGEPVAHPETEERLTHLMGVLTGVPDPALVWRLPRPSRSVLERRMERLARNTNVLYSFLQERRKEGRVSRVYHSVQAGQGLRAGREPWMGSLLYVQLPGVVHYHEYEELAKHWAETAEPALCIHQGGSFGFDTMRLAAVEESPEREFNSALRLSVGRDTAEELAAKLVWLDRMLPPGR